MQTYTFCCMPARVLVSRRIEVKPITLFETCQKAEINNHIVRLTFLIQASFSLNTYNAHLIMVVAIVILLLDVGKITLSNNTG